MKVALIVGISGQDGSYLAEHLLSLRYTVFGLVRREPQTIQYLRPILNRINFIYGDLRDRASLELAIHRSCPDEIYNLAPEGFVPTSWSQPSETLDTIAGGMARLLSIVDRVRPECRVYEASSSEMYGNVDSICDEETPMYPESPYGVAKLTAHRLVDVYRRKGLFAVGGILFNHESPRRAPEIVTKKIVRAVASWALGGDTPLELGNLESRRDWGFAGDYVRAIHLMLQNDKPTDYVIATGVSHSVSEFLAQACRSAGLDPAKFTRLVQIKEEFKRPNEIRALRGSAKKAHAELNWKPTVPFEELVQMMVRAEFDSLR